MGDDAKKKAATIVVGISGPMSGDSETSELKKDAANEIMAAIKDGNVDDLVESLSAFIMLCEEDY